MKFSQILVLLMFLTGCNAATKAVKDERKQWGFNNWKNDFKDRAFCLCLLEGYDNNEVTNFLLEKDKSFYNGVGQAIFDPVLKPIIQEEVEKIKRDSIESINHEAEGAAGKRVINHCLQFYKSKRLNSIAKSQVPKWRSIKNIEAIVTKEVPTY